MHRMKKSNISKEFLIKEYIRNEKSVKQIAQELKCSETPIRNRLIDYHIPMRTKSQSQKGIPQTQEHKNKIKKAVRRFWQMHPGISSGKNNANFGNRGSRNPLTGKKRPEHSRRMKEMWRNEEFRNKIVTAREKGLTHRPTKPEQILNNLLQQILLNEYKYVGDGKVVIGGFCPDFINCNGQKKIIEMYGDYWHNLPNWNTRDKRRLVSYVAYGYKTLIVWERELKDLDKVKNKILKFTR